VGPRAGSRLVVTVVRHHYSVMGTVFSFAFGAPIGADVVHRVEAELDRIDRVFSTYRPDSEITALAAGVGASRLSDDVTEVLDCCRRATELTGGYFSAYHLGRLDPTGLVKGWAVARAARLLTEDGLRRYAINGGGDVLVAADPASDAPWRIGISDGVGISRVVHAHNAAIATSGNTERPGEIVDPFTGRPALELRSVTVRGANIVMVDAVATAAVAMGRAAIGWLRDLPGFDAVQVSVADQFRKAGRGRPART
jgi:FAD:protein FMN transferase